MRPRLPFQPEARLLARALRSHRRRPDHPFKLTYAVTYGCQSGCRTCSIWTRRPKDELDTAEIRRLFAKAPGFSWVDLTGGEPFLRDDIVDIAAAVHESSRDLVLLHLPTNGLDPDRVERGVRGMLAFDPRRLILTVSVDGPPGLNEVLRGHPEAWTAAIETFGRLRRLRRHGNFDVYLGITLQEDNAEAAGEILSAARRSLPDLHQDELHWNLAQASSHFYGNEGEVDGPPSAGLADRLRVLSGDDESVRSPAALLSALHPVRWLDRRYRAHVDAFLADGLSPVRCRALWSTAFLDPHGRLYPCISWDRPLGGLREWDLDLPKLWASQGVLTAAAEVASGACPQCWTPCEAVPSMLGSVSSLLPARLS